MQKHLINKDAPIVEALRALNTLSGNVMTLFVTDSDGRLLGSLTDGDVRRALLAEHSLDTPVGAICRKDCLKLSGDSENMNVIAEARRRKVSLLPVVDGGIIVSLVDLTRRRGLLPVDAVLMAGGAGERLRPLTESVPKPLLPVGGKPIIDHNIELLHSFGIENIYVTVNYLKDKIIEHFRQTEPTVKCVAEPSRLGTAGSLGLIPSFSSPYVLLMNSDLLTDVNLEAMLLRHIDTEAAMTMAVVPYTVSVPFALVEHQGDRITALSEKPTYNYYANAGIYLMNVDVAKEIDGKTPLDAPALAESLIERGLRVSLFNIGSGRWIDIGSPDDYRHACELMK